MIEEEVLPAQGEDAIGTTSVLNWALTLDVPANKTFREQYNARYDSDPAIYAMIARDAGRVMIQAINATGGTDTAALIPAIENMTLDSPRGKLRFDAKTHEAVQSYYVRETRMVDGRPTNVVIADLPIVETPAKACDLA